MSRPLALTEIAAAIVLAIIVIVVSPGVAVAAIVAGVALAVCALSVLAGRVFGARRDRRMEPGSRPGRSATRRRV